MTVRSFKGLNNVSDPMRLGLDWLVQANNVDITDDGALNRRNGYTLFLSGSITGIYGTIDHQRAYYVDGTTLKDFAGAVLQTGLSLLPMYWAEVNSQVFFNNGIDSGIIEPDNTVLPWRASTLRDLTFLAADGTALDSLLYPLPIGADVVQHWGGRMYAAEYMHTQSQSIVWFSMPLGYHLFRLDTDFITVRGRVLMLAPHDQALIIGTDDAIYAYDGKTIETLADYGVVPGWSWAMDDDDKTVYIWSQRGLCKAMPFANLTSGHVSVAPGVQAGAAVIAQDGQKRFVVALQAGGTAFNQRN